MDKDEAPRKCLLAAAREADGKEGTLTEELSLCTRVETRTRNMAWTAP